MNRENNQQIYCQVSFIYVATIHNKSYQRGVCGQQAQVV